MALVQTAEYQYFRSLFEDVLTTLERVDVDALDPGLRSTVPSLRGSALKQLERYPQVLMFSCFLDSIACTIFLNKH